MINFVCEDEGIVETLRNKGFQGGDIRVVGIMIENTSKERYLISKDENGNRYTIGNVDVQKV